MRILQLSKAIANQIAAGEVIERPASIVKELLENCQDAKATTINIAISAGGLERIKVSDNGIGIMAEDLPLAIAQHATSKITKLADLYSISTMGFRGEALASIASISRLSISSKPANQMHAMQLLIQGEKFILEPCARKQGTTVEVQDLFYNAPVRKKFLKNAKIEFQAIEMVIRRFALSAPTIAIHLTHNERKVLELAAAHCDKSFSERIKKILGKNFIEQSNYIDGEHLNMRLYGWLGKKDFQHSQNNKQWIYLNQRVVKDRLLNHAMKQGYEAFLYPGRYPCSLLYLTIAPEEVDVNVHPTKHEVRFQQPRLVHDFITTQIIKNLSRETKEYESYPLKKETPSLKISETYYSPPQLETHKGKPFNQEWVIINADFCLIFFEEEPYLVNINLVQKAWLKTVLENQPFPLPSRPLLVPVSYDFKNQTQIDLNHLKQSLENFGIEINQMGESTLIIRSLPLALPHLNLKELLHAIFKRYPLTHEELTVLLITNQDFNARNTTDEEKMRLNDYMRTLEIKDSNRDKWRKQLSSKLCRDFLNG